jgi:hypothetical protein
MKGRRLPVFSGSGYQWEGWAPVGGGGHKERIGEGEYDTCILSSYENRRMKPVEIVLRRGREEEEKPWRG